MDRRERKNAAFIILAVFSVVVLLCIAFAVGGWTSLRTSLDVTVRSKLGADYSIEQEKMGDFGPDSSGSWWVRVKTDPRRMVRELPSAGFLLADSIDQEFYLSAIKKEFGNRPELTSYRVYRGELPLGVGTICVEFPCNFVILASEDSAEVYLEISKI